MRLRSLYRCGATTLLLYEQVALADLGIQANDVDTLKSAAKMVAAPMMEFYDKNQTEGIPGKLTGTWYVAGAMFMTLIQYWHASSDDTYNPIVSHDLMFQSGENYDFFSQNYSHWLGNDDQMFWGLASITASETGFPEIPGKPTWTSLARAVFNMQVARWDTTGCDGGMRWQIPLYLPGYTMKNAISNGGLFELSARLARFTMNNTYAQWAEKIWDWSASTPLLQTNRWYIADSTSIEANCKDAGNTQWSYNYGTYLSGASFMYNYTNGNEQWLERVNGLLNSLLGTFCPNDKGGNILSEVACEPIMTCDRNQIGFKGYTAMWLAHTAILVPSTATRIYPVLQGSALAISKQCSKQSGNTCGIRWWQSTWDGFTPGLESQMAALGGITANLMYFKSTAPKTIDTNPDGKEDQIIATHEEETPLDMLPPIGAADRAGAWILTVIIMVTAGGSVWWLVKT
ncbi:mannan endo-1,6-alpha-mannosidase DCW1 [Aspergillus lentulus]|nr:mannan endo-1,6-alpha-mannosidase DCW1 [Aspergillus lentulus]GFF49307.1 mannan endo-1,6-alpha-mannosidase DCW1 [Aspergillus lentulus]GFF82118.1 mannan endo-1,6-alpha-mannosidase DCW1 [Aspergillus lentulus]GFG05361.1 mannan endo-1,6-alpha-mannosidase DCW1 [Aspergillus lentulus]